MSGMTNLAPGSVVPQTGKYKCEFCGDGGIADLMGQLLGGSGLGLNTSRFEAAGRQSMTKFFEAGRTFPQCPTCGPATGWTLVEGTQPGAEDSPARHDASVSESGVCDICTQGIFRPSGYMLTTRDVVGTPAYWKHYCQYHRSDLAGMGVSSFDDFCGNQHVRTSCAEALAGQSTPWLLCEQCIQMFTVDRDQARSHARRWWESGRKYSPPGSGPAPLSSVNMGGQTVSQQSAPRRNGPRSAIGRPGALQIPSNPVLLRPARSRAATPTIALGGLLVALVVSAVVWFFVPAELAYRRARAADTAQGYQSFLDRHDGWRAGSTRRLLMERSFEEARARDDAPSFREFLKAFPGSPHEVAARDRMEQLAYVDADRRKGSAALREFLEEFPGGRLAERARESLELWSSIEAESKDDIPSWEAFSKEFPAGRYAEKARSRIEFLRRPVRRVALEVRTSTWRSGEVPFDVSSALRGQLAPWRVEFVPSDAAPVAALTLGYEERKGMAYSSFGGTSHGTSIDFDLKLHDAATGDLLLHLSTTAWTPMIAYGPLYEAALDDFREDPAFACAGALVAGALGETVTFAAVAPALVTHYTRPQALALVRELGLEPSAAAEEAALAVALGDHDRCIRLGTVAVGALLTQLDYYYLPTPERHGIVRALGEIGDPRGLFQVLSIAEDCVRFKGDAALCLAAIEAAGKLGNRDSLPRIEALARDGNRTFNQAAERAAASIRQRLGL